jgi:HSP20 family protein
MTVMVTGMPLPAPFLHGLREAMERLADGPLAPALDLYVTPRSIVAKVALPGPKPEDVNVTIDGGLVTISGSVDEERGNGEAGYVHKELTHGSFSRSFWLPDAIEADAASASFKDGLLTLTLPKTAEVEPKHVQVKVL